MRLPELSPSWMRPIALVPRSWALLSAVIFVPSSNPRQAGHAVDFRMQLERVPGAK